MKFGMIYRTGCQKFPIVPRNFWVTERNKQLSTIKRTAFEPVEWSKEYK